MAKPNEETYLRHINLYEAEGEQYVEDLNVENDLNWGYYFRELFGNERIGESMAVSSDCFDVVESDMPSHVRTFLGGGDILEFLPKNTEDEKQIMEAKLKTKYINRLLLDGRFKQWFDWLKSAEVSNYSIVTFYPEDDETPEFIHREGMSQIELQNLLDTLEDDDNVLEVEVEEQEDQGEDGFEVKIKLKRKKQKFCMEWIPEGQFIFVPAPSLKESPCVGHQVEKTKGELVGMFPNKKKEIKELTRTSLLNSDGIADAKEQQISGNSFNPASDLYENDYGTTVGAQVAPEWYAEKVVLKVLYVMIDKDGDGYPERRRILKCRDLILEDEPYDCVPYANLSCYPIPGKAIGKSRTGITRETQRQKSMVQRGMFNNIAAVSKPMIAVNIDPSLGSTANPQDIANRRTGGIIRTKGDPSAAIFPQVVTPVLAEALQVIQYMDFTRAQSTGSLMASQGMDKEQLYNETATRFTGIQDEGKAKIELVQRIFAETGIKDLYEIAAWTVQNYQNADAEVVINGEQIAFNPSEWKYEHSCKPRVGLAAADTEELKVNLMTIIQMLQGLQAMGSTLADESKIYNALKKLLNAMGVYDVSEFINNPEIPADVAQAQLEQSRKLIAQLQAQTQNPLAEAETIKAKAKLLEVQAKDQTERDKARADLIRQQEELRLKQAEFEASQEQFRMTYAKDIANLELQYNKDLNGGADEL